MLAQRIRGCIFSFPKISKISGNPQRDMRKKICQTYWNVVKIILHVWFVHYWCKWRQLRIWWSTIKPKTLHFDQWPLKLSLECTAMYTNIQCRITRVKCTECERLDALVFEIQSMSRLEYKPLKTILTVAVIGS